MKIKIASGHFSFTVTAPCTSMSNRTSMPASSLSRMTFRDVP